MRYLKPKPIIGLAVALSLLAGCGKPTVNVKKDWYEAMISYSFVPLYPARGDVAIGDIRIHRVKEAAKALDSRLISKGSKNGLDTGAADPSSAILPGIEAFRLLSVDTNAIGLGAVVRRILGARIDASSTLYVSLQDLETQEIADHKVAFNFRKRINDHINPYVDAQTDLENEFLWGLCAAAKSLDDPEFEDIGISVITRIVRANKMAYYSGRGLSNVPQQAEPAAVAPTNTAGTVGQQPAAAPTNESGNSFSLTSGSRIPEQKLKPPVVVGVDALMLDAAVVLGQTKRQTNPLTGKMETVPLTIGERCAPINANFKKSQLDALRNRGRAPQPSDK